MGQKYKSILNSLKFYRRDLEARFPAARRCGHQEASGDVSAAVGYERTRLLCLKGIAANPEQPIGEVVNLSKLANWAERERNAAVARLEKGGTMMGSTDPLDPVDDVDLTEET